MADAPATGGLAAAAVVATLLAVGLAVLGGVLRRQLQARARLQSEAGRARAEADALAVQLQEQATELEQQIEEAHASAEEAEQASQQALGAAHDAEQARARVEESERALRHAMVQQHQLIDNAVDAIFVADTNGRDMEVNPAACRLLHYTADELRGVAIADLVGADDVPRLWALRKRLLAGASEVSEWRLRRGDGEFVPVEISTAMLPDGRWQAVARDISERKRAEAVQTFLMEASRVLGSSLDYEATLTEITRHAIPFLADYASVDLVTESGAIRRVETAHVDPAKEPIVRDMWTRYPYASDDPVGVPQAIRDGTLMLMPMVSDEAVAAFARSDEHLALLKQLAPCSFLCVPLVARGRAFGAISLVYSDSGRRYTPADVDVATDLAHRAGIAIDNARLFSAEQEARRRAERVADLTARLQRVTAALARAVTLDEAGAVAVAESADALGGNAGTLALLSPDGSTFVIVASTIGEAAPANEPLPVSAPVPLPLGDAVRTRQPVLLTSRAERVARYPAFAASPAGSGFGALAAVPLVVGERVLGGLIVSYTGGRTFDADDRNFLEAVGRIAAQAVERAQLYRAERRARERMAFLADATALLASSLDYETTLARTADLAVPRLSDWCAIDLLDADGVPRRVTVVHRDPAKLALGLELDRRYPRDPDAADPVAAVLRTGQAMLIPLVTDDMLPSLARDADHLALIRAIGFNSVMLVPLVARDRTLGLMTFVASELGRHHDADDLALAEEVARRAAVAVDNARLFREAEDARTTAEAANRLKSDFLATMSHEIRTPINAILGYTQLLELGIPGAVTAEQRAQLERINVSGRLLLGLINDVLDLAKIEAGHFAVGSATAEAGAAVDAALSLMRPQAAAKGLVLSAQCEGLRTAAYVGDEQRVQQVMVNLLSNAVKFTPPGGRISVSCGSAEHAPPGVGSADAGPWTFFSVEDTGIGIAHDKADAIFRPFEQAEAGYRRTHSGTGLGLTISRRLARLMGGDVTVESTVGRGSTFTLWLPALHAAAAIAESPDESAGAPRDHEDASLAQLGRTLLDELDAIIERLVAEMRTDGDLPHVGELTDVQLQDHYATWLADVAQSLIILHAAGGEPAELIRDGSEIQRTISERHGAQRYRLGWSEDALAREFELLHAVLESTLARRVAPAASDVAARAVLTGFMKQAERISRQGFRHAAGTTLSATADAVPRIH